jgi:sugar lactone lactonase YvrE
MGYWIQRAVGHVAALALLTCVAVDDAVAGVVFVSSQGNNSVLRYDAVTGVPLPAPGQTDATFVSPNSSGLNNPQGVVFGPDGNLYVSSFATNNVLRFSGVTGAPLPAPGQTGAIFIPAGSGGLFGPGALALGPDNNLYVSGFGDGVLRYNGTTGAFINAFVPTGSTGPVGPAGIIFGPDNNLYVSDPSNNRVLRYNGVTGTPLPAPGQTGATFIAAGSGGLKGSNGLAFGPDNNLFVVSSISGGPFDQDVLRFNGVSGAPLPAPGQTGAIFVAGGSGGLTGAINVAFGPDNNLYVNSLYSNALLRYNGTTGAFIDTFVTPPGPTFFAFIPIAVPEPSTLVMGGTAALLGLGYAWRRGARKAGA